MRQPTLLDATQLAGALTAIKAAMRGIAGAAESEGRKALPDRLNALARQAGVKLTQGNKAGISKDTLDKWLAPSDTSHPPSVLALLAYYLATGSADHLRAMMNCVGLDIMTDEDRKFAEYGRAVWEAKAARERKRKLESVL